MVAIETIARFDLVVGTLASIGLVYLLYSETVVVHYRRFFRLMTIGLLAYAVTGPVIGRLAPAFIHGVHGIAALFISLGLYELIRTDLQRGADFSRLLAEPPPGEGQFTVGEGASENSPSDSEAAADDEP